MQKVSIFGKEPFGELFVAIGKLSNESTTNETRRES
jgi:hypothetical protein